MGMIYHYCTPQVFKSIVENKILWLSATNNMNDFTEGAWFTSALNHVLSGYKTNALRSRLELMWSTYLGNNTIRYATCFSKSPDVLSQWRAYAQNGEGVAIGFDEDRLKLKNGTPVTSVFAEDYIKIVDIMYFERDSLEAYIKEELDLALKKDNYETVMLELALKFASIAMVAKNPAFTEEDEKRIVYAPLITGKEDTNETNIFNPISPINFRLTGSSLTSYFEFNFSELDAITQVILGPRNTFSSYDIELFLSINGLPKASITKSKATYR